MVLLAQALITVEGRDSSYWPKAARVLLAWLMMHEVETARRVGAVPWLGNAGGAGGKGGGQSCAVRYCQRCAGRLPVTDSKLPSLVAGTVNFHSSLNVPMNRRLCYRTNTLQLGRK